MDAKIISVLDGQFVKLANIKNELVWHSHQAEDEMLIVFNVTLIVEFRNKPTVTKQGKILMISKTGEHNTIQTEKKFG